MIDYVHSAEIVLVIAIVTALIRFSAFFLFSKKTPKWLIYLSKVLPYSVMPMLLVFCVKNVKPTEAPYGIPEIVSITMVALLYKWKHNSIISIVGGTLCYMFFVQKIFV